MPFGDVIDNDYLRRLPRFQGLADSKISQLDRANVAIEMMGKYKEVATKRVDILSVEYGSSTAALVRVYNATGGRLGNIIAKSWAGKFFKEAPEQFLENGQWSVFVHAPPNDDGPPPEGGSEGGVTYRTVHPIKDIFVGWNVRAADPNQALPPSTGNSVYAEVQDRNYYFAPAANRASLQQGLKDSLDRQTERYHVPNAWEATGYKVWISAGDSRTAYVDAIIMLNA